MAYKSVMFNGEKIQPNCGTSVCLFFTFVSNYYARMNATEQIET